MKLEDLEKTAEAIIEELRGTCNSLQPVLEAHDAVDVVPVLNIIDSEIFECEVCGWWCEASEMCESGGDVCDQCNPDDPDE